MAHITADELKSLFLFESLTDEQLQWIAERAESRTYDAGATVVHEGDEADYLYVLLEGRIRMSRQVSGEDMVINETDYRGVYIGRDPLLRLGGQRQLLQQLHRDADADALLTAAALGGLRRADAALVPDGGPPARRHLPRGAQQRGPDPPARAPGQPRLVVGQPGPRAEQPGRRDRARDRPAARADREDAAQARGRRGRQLRPRHDDPARRDPGAGRPEVDRSPSVPVAGGAVRPRGRAHRPDGRARRAPAATTWPRSSPPPAWTSAGSRRPSPWPDRTGDRSPAVAGDTLETEALMDEIEDASTRISTLVAAVKRLATWTRRPSRTRPAPGARRTVVMLGRKLDGITVTRDYDLTLPQDPGLRRGAQPGVDQPHRQRRRRDGRARRADAAHPPRRRRGDGRRSATPAPGSRPRCSRPDLRGVLHDQTGRARAAGSGWTTRSASSSSATAGGWTSARAPTARPSRSGCR